MRHLSRCPRWSQCPLSSQERGAQVGILHPQGAPMDGPAAARDPHRPPWTSETLLGHPIFQRPVWCTPHFRVPSWGTMDSSDPQGASTSWGPSWAPHISGSLPGAPWTEQTHVGHPIFWGPSWDTPYFRVPSWGTMDSSDPQGASHIMGTLLGHPTFQRPMWGTPNLRDPSWATLDSIDPCGTSHILGTLLGHPTFQRPMWGTTDCSDPCRTPHILGTLLGLPRLQ